MKLKERLLSIAKHHFWHYLIFWGYNLICFGFFLLASQSFLWIFMQISIPWNVALMLYTLMLTPIVSIVIGFLPRFRRDSKHLLKYFFGIEIPLVILAFIRLVFIREMTPVLWLIFISGFAGIVGLLISLLEDKFQLTKKQSLGLFITQQLVVLLGSYLGLLGMFIVPIIAVSIIRGLVSINYLALISEIFSALFTSKGTVLLFLVYGLIFILPFFLTALLFLISPIASVMVYWKSYRQKLVQLKEQFSPVLVKRLDYGVAIGWLFLLLFLSWQPDASWYQRDFETFQRTPTFEAQQTAAQTLAQKADGIKSTLVNNYSLT